MFRAIGQLLSPPVFEDEAKTQVTSWLNAILLALLAATVVAAVLFAVFEPSAGLLITVASGLFHIGLLFLVRRGRVQSASILLVLQLLGIATLSAYVTDGINAGVVTAYFLILAIAALLLGGNAVLILASLCILALWGLFYAGLGDITSDSELADVLGRAVIISLVLGMTAIVLRFTIRHLNNALEYARSNERALIESNRELRAEITERERAEEALRGSEAELAAVFDSVGDGITLIDRTGRVVRVNRRIVEVGGYTEEEIVGKRFEFLNMFPPHSFKKIVSRFATLISGQQVPPFEVEVYTKAGRKLDIELRGSLLRRGGKAVGIVGVMRDITERKQAEEALRQYTAELEARNEELDAFAHTVAHDLKNPLGLVVGHAETLEADYDTLPSEALQVHVRAIARNTRRVSRIIDELLLLSGLRQMEVEMMPLDMASIVAEARQRLAYMIEGQQAEIVLPETWPVALGYGPWIEEVWINYLDNAIKYGGRPPRVELGAAAQPEGMVRFWIRDNGPGLKPEEQARLFTPFTRLDQVHARGHGLGLSIVRRIVEKLGGQVEVESEVGQGSTFAFTLPGMTGGK